MAEVHSGMVVRLLYALRIRIRLCVAVNMNDSHVADRKTQFGKILLFSIGINNRLLPSVFAIKIYVYIVQTTENTRDFTHGKGSSMVGTCELMRCKSLCVLRH